MAEQLPDYSGLVDDAPKPEDLKKLATLLQQQYDAEKAVEEAEETLAKAKTARDELAGQTVPSLMERLGVATFTTTSGLQVSVVKKLYMSIPKGTKPEAMQWIEDHGGEKLVKRAIVILFGKGEQKWATRVMANFRRYKHPLPMTITQDVAPASAKKFISDQMEEGVDVPMKTFGAFEKTFAEIKVTTS